MRVTTQTHKSAIDERPPREKLKMSCGKLTFWNVNILVHALHWAICGSKPQGESSTTGEEQPEEVEGSVSEMTKVENGMRKRMWQLREVEQR